MSLLRLQSSDYFHNANKESPLSAPLFRTILAAVLTCCIATPASAALDARIQTAAEQAKAPTLKLLEQLVNIDSGSGYGPGLT